MEMAKRGVRWQRLDTFPKRRRHAVQAGRRPVQTVGAAAAGHAGRAAPALSADTRPSLDGLPDRSCRVLCTTSLSFLMSVNAASCSWTIIAQISKVIG